jgi:hypothetical protein
VGDQTAYSFRASDAGAKASTAAKMANGITDSFEAYRRQIVDMLDRNTL